MTLLKTPICEFGKKAENFKLKSTDNKIIDLNDVKGKNGTLIMFICNHCPYVVATIEDIVKTTNELKNNDIKSIAIMSNDPTEHPEDSFENMIEFAKKYNFNFPYVIDEDQSVAIKYDAVCTPDFFGFNSNLKLQYRGRIYEINNRVRVKDSKNELLESMINVAKTSKGPEIQSPSMGCSIKWFK